MKQFVQTAPAEQALGTARSGWRRGWLWGSLALLPLALFLLLLSRVEAIAVGNTSTWAAVWAPSLGVSASFTLDGLSLLFALLISGMGALIMFYASSYLADHPQLGRFYFFIMLFMLAMLGLVLSGNLLLLFIFWELTSISSYLLIGFKHQYEESRQSALQALLVTGGGGLALLTGLLLLGQISGSFELAVLMTQGDVIREHALYGPVLLLILLGAFTKSAQVPFHFWLPGAMAAPTPVSAYLHSATMVKAGVYLVARLAPVLGATALWQGSLTVVGGLTFLVGAIIAWRQTDLKRILAYSTVSALGALFFLLGIGTAVAIKAAVLFLLAHALYKGALFMVAGNVDHATGTRDVTQLHGLGRAMPLTALAAALAGLSMAGLPPLAGFVTKELLYEATLYLPVDNQSLVGLLTGVALLANVLTVLAAGLVAGGPFWGQPAAVVEKAHDAFGLWFSPLLLAAGGLLAGLFVGVLGVYIVEPAASAIAGAPQTVKLSLWHGVNPMLVLSVITVAAGVGGYAARSALGRWTQLLDRIPGAARSYDVGLDGMLRGANWLTRHLQHGYLRGYLLTIILTAIGAVGFTLLTRQGLPSALPPLDVRLYEAAVLGLILVAAGMTILVRARLTAIVAVGTVGFGMTLLFILFSAPDLAMTQFAVETLTVILFVFVLYRLPRFANLASRATRIRDGIVALAAGALMTLLVLTVTAAPHATPLTDYFAANSWTEAKGRNVVNVILVDFRALDTLGEIIVLTVAALGVYALIRSGGQAAQQNGAAQSTAHKPGREQSVILSTATRYLLPLLLLFSFFLLLRGHNLPGGGFVGGLVAAAAFALFAIAAGVRRARRALGVELRTLVGVGLLCALSSGLLALLLGAPFMTGLWSVGTLPILGKLGTPLFFDVGVYLVVIGVALLILFALMAPPIGRRLKPAEEQPGVADGESPTARPAVLAGAIDIDEA